MALSRAPAKANARQLALSKARKAPIIDLKQKSYLSRCLREATILDFDSRFDLYQFVKAQYGVQDSNVSAREVQENAEKLSKAVLDAYERLRFIMRKHGSTIQKRWTTKSTKYRRSVIAAAHPSVLPETRRSDFRALYNVEKERNDSVRNRDLYLLPYLNYDNLLEKETLLFLLEARSCHHPSEFAHNDCDSMRVGLIFKIIVPVFLESHVMVLNGRKAKQEYGRVISVKYDEETLSKYPIEFVEDHMYTQFAPGEGLLVLEAQSKLLPFLIKCCRLILHDVIADNWECDPQGEATSATNPQPTSSAIDARSKAEQPRSLHLKLVDMNFAALTAKTPYKVSGKPILSQMLSTLLTRLDAANDHVWNMKEDPGYFAEHLTQLKLHRPEFVKDEHGQQHRSIKPDNEAVLTSAIISDLMVEACTDVEMYTLLFSSTTAMYGMLSIKNDINTPGAIVNAKDLGLELAELGILTKGNDSLSELHNVAVSGSVGQKMKIILQGPWPNASGQLDRVLDYSPSIIHYLLDKFYGILLQRLAQCIACPALRDFAKRKAGAIAKVEIMIPESSKSRLSETELRVLTLLKTLCENDPKLALLRGALILDELDRLFQSERFAKNMISARTAGVLGDLAILTQYQTELLLFQPSAHRYHPRELKKAQQAEAYIENLLVSFYELEKVLLDPRVFVTAAHICEPWTERFAFPAEKLRNKNNVDTMRQSEQNLDKLWACIDRVLQESCNRGTGSLALSAFKLDRPLKRTPPWNETVQPRKPKVDSKDIGFLGVTEGSQEPSSIDTLRKKQVKLKVKTRGTVVDRAPALRDSFVLTDSTPTVGQDDQTEAIEMMSVDSRALKVAKTLFHDPHVTSTPGEIPWKEFLHFFASLKFEVTKLRGSAWQFVRSLDEKRITFHEPHPFDKIPFQTARFFGRRLAKRFGWTGEAFVLKEAAIDTQ